MAPSPALFRANPRAVSMLESIPPWAHGDPDIRASIYVQAREADLLEQTMDEQLAQSFPTRATELGLPWWERLVRTTGNPAGLSVAQRRELVLAYLQKLSAGPSGTDWRDNVTRLVGPGWTYREHVPGDVLSPAENTLLITLPFPPSSSLYAQTERLLRDITPAHLDLVLGYSGGFILDQSQLDQEPLL